jgi:hypothetical protein
MLLEAREQCRTLNVQASLASGEERPDVQFVSMPFAAFVEQRVPLADLAVIALGLEGGNAKKFPQTKTQTKRKS